MFVKQYKMPVLCRNDISIVCILSNNWSEKNFKNGKNLFQVLCLLVMVTITISEAFFLQSKDIRRMLRFFPGFGETTHREDHVHHPHQRPTLYLRRYQENNVPSVNNRNRDDYYNDRYEKNRYSDRYDRDRNNDSYDKERNGNRYYKNEDNDDRYNDDRNNIQDRRFSHRYKNKPETADKKPYYHENCSDPSHNHHPNSDNRKPQKFPENRYQNQRYENYDRSKYEVSEDERDYYDDERPSYSNNDRKNYRYSKKTPPKYDYEKQNESDKYDKSVYDKYGHLNYKKDYVTGVLVTIPKIKNDEDLTKYFKNSKEQNLFFQNLLKTENEHDHEHDHNHNSPEELIKAYLY